MKRALLSACCAMFTLLSALQSQAQNVNSDLAEKLKKSVELRFVSRDLIDMTNTFYEAPDAQSNKAMYLSLHIVLEDSRNGEVYASFVLPPTQKFGRIQLKKEITPRTVNHIEVKFFYDAYSATHDARRVYWELKQGQLGRALWEIFQLYIFRDGNTFEKLLKYFSEGLEGDEFSPPPNPLEFLGSLVDLFSNPDFNKLPPDIQYKLRFIADSANDPQYIKGISYNMKYLAHNLGVLKLTPTFLLGVGVPISGFSSSKNPEIAQNFGLDFDDKLPFTLRGKVGLPTEHKILGWIYGRFYLSGFYEQTFLKVKSDVFVSNSYILQPNVQSLYEAVGQTNFKFTNYGIGLTYAIMWNKRGALNFEAGAAQINGKVNFSETSLANGVTLKSKKFDVLESSDNNAPYWEVGLVKWADHWQTHISLRVIYSEINFKKDFELYSSRNFNQILLGNRIASLQIGINIVF